MARTVTLADGTVVPAVDYDVYVDEESGVVRNDYERNTPQSFVSEQEQMIELEREIKRLQREQLQHTLAFNHGARAALEPQIQDLQQQLAVLQSKYRVT